MGTTWQHALHGFVINTSEQKAGRSDGQYISSGSGGRNVNESVAV